MWKIFNSFKKITVRENYKVFSQYLGHIGLSKQRKPRSDSSLKVVVVVVVVLLFYVHGKHLRSCRDGQLT